MHCRERKDAQVHGFPRGGASTPAPEAFPAVMNMIALPEWSPDLVAERTGRSRHGAEISHELQDLFCAAAGCSLVEAGGSIIRTIGTQS